LSNFFLSQRPRTQKRLPQEIGVAGSYPITLYDRDNLYPQRMDQLCLRSPLTKQAIKALADFINGEGFTQNEDVELNEDWDRDWET
jgi:hypothetical protein